MSARRDFCDKPYVGYGFQHCAFYCEDHEKEAQKIEDSLIDEMESAVETINEL